MSMAPTFVVTLKDELKKLHGSANMKYKYTVQYTNSKPDNAAMSAGLSVSL
jgi:hypothetical protein